MTDSGMELNESFRNKVSVLIVVFLVQSARTDKSIIRLIVHWAMFAKTMKGRWQIFALNNITFDRDLFGILMCFIMNYIWCVG